MTTKKTTRKKVTKKKATRTPPLPANWKLPRLRDEGVGWSLKKPVPGWGGARMQITIERIHDEERPSPEQEAALAGLLTNQRDLRPAFAKGAFRYFNEVIVPKLGLEWVEEQVHPPIRKLADLWPHFNHWAVWISAYRPGEIELSASCAFTGHEFGARFVDFKVTQVGDVANDCPFVL